MNRIKVIIESPFAGEVHRNILYAKRAMLHSISLGEAPFASHLLYTQEGLLDDTNLSERNLGMTCGFSWFLHADLIAVYQDYGISPGMRQAIALAKEYSLPVVYRVISRKE